MHREKYKILTRVLGASYRSGDEHLYHCPKCKHHKKKLSVNIALNKFKCWICEYAGHNLRKLIKEHGNQRCIDDWSLIDGESIDISSFENIFKDEKVQSSRERVELPQDFQTLTGRASLVSSPAKKYLQTRGITKKDIVKWKIGYCPSGDYEGRVVVPSFSSDGELNYFVARSYNGSWKKYMNPSASRDIIFNDLMIDWESDIVLVEGVFDALIAGDNSIPLLGSQIRENSVLFQKIIEKKPKVYLALDPDIEKKSAKIIKKMLTYGVELVKVEVKPYSDVGEMSKEEFQRRKEGGKTLSTSFGDYFSYLLGHTVKI